MLPFFEKKDTDFFVYEYRNFSFPAHLHPTLEIVWARKGSIILTIDETRHILQEGELGIIFPGKVHCYEYHSSGEGSIFLLGSTVLNIYKNLIDGKEPVHCIVKDIHSDAYFALERLRLTTNKTDNYHRAYAGLFLYCLFEVLELCDASEKLDLLPLVVDYMEKNFTKKLSLDTVASALYVSRYTISRLFNKKLNSSFTDYLNTIRVRHSIGLIANGKSISESAFESGFENLRTFNRAFKKATGKCPKDYRAKHSVAE